jgi:hypothetical protein
LRFWLGHVAAVEEFALQKSPETRANVGNARLAYAPRAFLRFFITNTFNHRLLACVACLCAQRLWRLALVSAPLRLKSTIKDVAVCAMFYWAGGQFHH